MSYPRNEAEARALLVRMVKAGCPTRRCDDGSRTRQGRACCIFCDAVIELDEPHGDDCLWRDVERIASIEGKVEP